MLIGRLVSRLRKTKNIVVSMTDTFTYNAAAKLACRFREVNSAREQMALPSSVLGTANDKPGIVLLAKVLTFVVSYVVDIDARLTAWLDFAIAVMLCARHHFLTARVLATSTTVWITAVATLVAALAKICSLGKGDPATTHLR